MEGIKNFFNDKIIPKVIALTEMRYLKVITNAFMSITALTIGGSIFTLIVSLPLGNWYTNFLEKTNLNTILRLPVSITTDLMAIYLVFAIGNHVAKSFNRDGFAAGIVSVGAFFLLTPMVATATYEVGGETASLLVNNVIPTNVLGQQGIFLALIVGLIASRIYVFCIEKNWKIKMPESVPQNVSSMFENMIPAGLVFIVFLIIRVGFEQTDYGTAQSFVYNLLQTPLEKIGGGIGGVSVQLLFMTTLWIFGIHGTTIVYSVMMPIIMTASAGNQAAFANGEAVPYLERTLNPYTAMGGTGATLGLAVLLLFYAKSSHLKALGKMSFMTSLFNINEPLAFGLPIVLNPILAIPYILIPQVNLFLSYFIFKVGLLPQPTGANINAFMPWPFYGGLATGNYSGFVMSILILVVDIIIWFPFFKAQDNKILAEENRMANKQKVAV